MSAVQKPERTPQDSQQIEFPADSWQTKLKKWGGLFAIAAGIVATIWGAQTWFTDTINASALEVKNEVGAVETRINKRIDEKMEAHADTVHEDAVPREVYDLHVKAQEKANEKIQKKLDLIGEGTYRSPSRWERRLEREGLKPQEEP